jgi:integrase
MDQSETRHCYQQIPGSNRNDCIGVEMAKSSLLTAAFCRNTKIPKLHADGNGLYLRVVASGARSWVFRYRWQGKRPDIGLGGFTDVSLAEAREKAADCRKLIRQGVDPRGKSSKATSSAATFSHCADQFIKSKRAEWKNSKHALQWSSTLETYAFPVIGDMPVGQVGLDEVLAVLEPIWLTRNETASRVRGRVENILSWATVKGYRKPPNPAMWRGNLDMLLPKPSRVQPVRHYAALPYADMPGFMKNLSSRTSITSKALKLCILTTTRTGELIAAKWSEFDLSKGIWTIPADRTKTGKEHRIPLVPAVLELLDSIPVFVDDDYLFPALRGEGHMSNMAMLQLLKRDMGYPDLTVHGFRSTFKDWSVEETRFPGELSEAQLSHVIQNAAQAAYERGDKLARRRELLQAWSAYCE